MKSRNIPWSVRVLAAAAISLACGTTPINGEGSCWPGLPGTDPAQCPPNDPRFARRWEFLSRIPDNVDASRMHPAEAALGSIGFSLDRAWQVTTGRDDVVIAVLDSGIRWRDRDLRRKLYINRGELPLPLGATTYDSNGDGIFDVDDYTEDDRVEDRNENGLLDAGDLIAAFSDCRDDDGNGYVDDISGHDFQGRSYCGSAGGDNDPHDATDFGHGTGIASTAAAETDNGLGDAGVCPRCRILPVRVGDSFVVDANRFAQGVVFAVRSGASVIASALGSYNNTPTARRAVDFAYERGVPLIASAADEFSYHHNYPSVYNHTLYVNAIRYNDARSIERATTFWGLNPCTNFGPRVTLSVPATSCSSGATSRLAGTTGLLLSAARDSGIRDLHAEEVYQLLRANTDDLDNSQPDWGDLLFPARAGFDALTGYGRLNAWETIAAVKRQAIPPMADLSGPRWFAVVSPTRTPRLAISGSVRVPRTMRGTYRLDYALGVEPSEADWIRIGSGSVHGVRTGTLGVIDFSRVPLPGGPPPVDREDRNHYGVTIRLQAIDVLGRRAEARRVINVFDDPTWKTHFPFDLVSSGEASPLLVDLDADGRDEIVLPTADGYLRIFRWSRTGLAQLKAPLDLLPPVDPVRPGIETRETVIRGAAVGDLGGEGRPAIVVASRRGKVYAFDARGERLGGFPVTPHPSTRIAPTKRHRVEDGFLSRPVLADLDGKPGLEIVVSGLDGHVHAWNGDGTPLEGFPVRLGPFKIVSSPAVGDIDGDGTPEIVVGSNQVEDGLASAWAIRARGNADPRGALLPGWAPFRVGGIRSTLLPTLARGVQMTPQLVDVDRDGDREVVLYAVTGPGIVLVDHPAGGPPVVVRRYSMTPGEGSGFRDITFLAGSGSALVTVREADGEPELYVPLLPFRMLSLRSKPGVPMDVPLALGGWDLRSSAMLPGFPRRMEDLMVWARPSAADVDRDGVAEIFMGSGGYLLHAFDGRGGEAAGFPKFTGGWIFSEPATGDLDGDGRKELVTVTREGYLFAWELQPQADGSAAR